MRHTEFHGLPQRRPAGGVVSVVRLVAGLAVGCGATLAAVALAGHTPGLTAWRSVPKGNRFRAEIVREALDSPGSWYLDRPTGTLTSCPRGGRDEMRHA